MSLDAGLDQDALLGLAQRLSERCLARGAAEAECFVEAARSLSVELEAGRISVTSADHTIGVGIRVLHEGRIGFASASGSKESSLAAAIEAAIETADRGPREGYHLPTPEPSQPVAGIWDDAVAQLAAGDIVQAADGLVRRWKEVAPDADLPGGGVEAGASVVAVASSRGIQHAERSTSTSAAVSLVERGDATVSAWEAAVRTGPFPFEDVVDEAARKLKALRKPADAPFTGPCDVVLAPEAASELLVGFALGAVHGDEAMRGNTKWSGKLGESVADPGLRLADEPRTEGRVGASAFDGEGVPTRRVPIIEDGVLKEFLFDTWNGHRHARPTTASAVRSGYEDRPSIGTHHLVLRHQRSLDDIVSDVDRGYLVDTLLGAHTANATTGDFSVTAPNVWAIEGGAIQGPCKEIALGGSVPDVLMQVRSVAKEAKMLSHGSVPAVLAGGFQASS